ncbi:MAG: glutaredoxin [Clostridiales bacterium]|jgi:glutaredoxin|nr:glutaredoxin [Clostridiales bacterium]
MANVDIYSSDTCGYCHAAIDFFKANNVEYTEHNISKDPEAKKFLMAKGIRGVPFIIIDGEEVMGFDEDILKKLLKL